MKTLLYKQLRLVCHPMTPVFCLFGAMLLIPNYPYSVTFFYVTLGLFFTFLNFIQPITTTFFTSIGKPGGGIFLSLTRQIIFLLPLILIIKSKLLYQLLRNLPDFIRPLPMFQLLSKDNQQLP